MNKKIKAKEFKIFYGLFEDAEDVFNGFSISSNDWKDIKFVYAAYEYEDYTGLAHIIFIKDGKLYEVNESHCSCNGLESWEPEETSVIALLSRPNVSDAAKDNLKKLYKNIICFA